MKRLFMTPNKKTQFTILLLTLITLLTGCSGTGGDAASGVENYLEALVNKDAPRLVNYSCAKWEADANLELDSFAAVEVRLENMACQVNGEDGEIALVACTGALIANYEGEDQQFDLADRIYEVVNEGGEWRVCGYR